MTVELRNGRSADSKQVAVVKDTLHRLFNGSRGSEGLAALDWLVRYAKRRTPGLLEAMPSRYVDLLRYEGFVNPLSGIDAAILDIVDACVNGEGFDMTLVPPEKRDATPLSGQVFRVADRDGGAMRIPVDKISGWLGFSPERREVFASDPSLSEDERNRIASEISANLHVDPALVEVAERPHLFGLDGYRYLSLIVELNLRTNGSDGTTLRFVVGSNREAS